MKSRIVAKSLQDSGFRLLPVDKVVHSTRKRPLVQVQQGPRGKDPGQGQKRLLTWDYTPNPR